MKAVGIVAEYNPFHSGHRYQIRKIREIFGAETPVAAVMSGDFVQRGEAASYDKFTRAEAAVRGGVSLVIELPLPWSLSSAESFARGGVGLLGAAGVIDALSFGSESGDLSALEKTAAVLDTPEFAEALKRELTGGTPFAAARARAAHALLGESAAVLDTPNDLLAVEYIRAAAKLGYIFDYTPVRREGSTHDGAGSASELDDICMDLSSLLFGASTGTVSQSDLDALNAELHQLEKAGVGRGSITAPAAGLFTSTVDGYEALSPAALENLTPDGVAALEHTSPSTPANTIGKLVTAKKWYFAAVMSKADADRLNLGGSATLDFPQHYSGTVSATVFSKSEPDSSGEVAVVFACNNALADTLAMRKATADVVYSEHTGLRVPLKAVHMDDDGQTFVYVVTAAQLEKKPIEIIYQTDSYCLVAQSTDSNALRAGNDIVVSGKGLSDGQVIK